MNDWFAPTAILTLLGILGTYVGLNFTRKNNKDTLLLSSRDEHIDDLREDLRDMREQVSTLNQEMKSQAEEIKSQGEKIQRLQVQDWWLRRYIYDLLDRIRALGGEPPEPPKDLKL